ncbi:MAG: PepSY domain-containing protein [Gemmatimonadota bacterium]
MKRFTLIAVMLLAPATAASAQQGTAVKEETAGLLAQATVTPDSARRVALRTVPGGKIAEAEIEMEHGKLVYSFDIRVEGKPGVDEVQVNAKTGAVESMEHEDEEAEASESHETSGSVELKEEERGLLAQATIRPDSARHLAMNKVPGGKVVEAVIEREDGRIVYSFELKVAGKSGVEEVLVDARTGAVVSVEHES